MDMKRKAARGIAVVAVALAAGHLVQSMGDKPTPRPTASAELTTRPAKVETVAAGPGVVAAEPAAEAAPLPAAPMAATLPPASPTFDPTLAPVTAEVAPAPDAPAVSAAEPSVVVELRKADADLTAAAGPCDMTLDLMNEPNAMIGVTLIAPCNPNQRVVLRQGGLAVTGQTTSTGALFTAIPAFETDAGVEVLFPDGSTATGRIAVPDLAKLRRFGVQWQADDAFQVHAFENGASYGQPGHVSAADPHRPAPGLAATGGFLTLLGDSATENPLLAEVYTFPADPRARTEVVVEAAVTEKTCARELLAETLTSTGGSVFVTDLTLAMPDCDAVGDYLVLKNLVLDLNMAAAN